MKGNAWGEGISGRAPLSTIPITFNKKKTYCFLSKTKKKKKKQGTATHGWMNVWMNGSVQYNEISIKKKQGHLY